MHTSNNLIMTSHKQVPDVNYNCRSQIKETDVSLLVACKLQLSSEVIQLKTETLRLRKECDLAHQKSKERDQAVSKLLEKTKTLESQLTQLEEENKHLKLKNIVIGEEKVSSIQRLSQSLNKLNSFPSTFNDTINPTTSRFLRQGIVDPEKYQDQISGDWRKVSQEMLKRMQLEMKELQGINLCMKSDSSDQDDDHSDSKKEMEDSISSLLTDTEALKCKLLSQREKLHLLLKNVIKDTTEKDSISSRKQNISSVVDEKTSSIRIQQCNNEYGSGDLIQELKGVTELCLQNESDALNSENICTTLLPSKESIKNQHPIGDPNTTLVMEERVCPICQQQFDISVPQPRFEEHVFNHLEAESESLLEHYVVL